ncbi:acyl-CoA dehydrogenase family protein [Streptomyces sp. NPDC005820]|uniref:acyl-CoA dehydrogenase family protein n=1 Tax=Streptomyces sp. NPDC005820 TaxID=3157069 RepID=UPI0033C657EC
MNLTNGRYPAVADLERFLGDPRQPGTPFSYRDIVESEETGRFPEGTVPMLRTWGFQDFLVPGEHGGRLRSLEELFLLTRVVSQRNVAVSVRLGSTFLGGLPAWLWGSGAQRETLAREILGGRPTSMAISEAAHGSDFNSNEAVAMARRQRHESPLPHGVRAYGEELLAGSGRQGGVGSGALGQPPARQDGRVPGPREGTGLGQSLKMMQITRALVPALSIGTMDATVRIALAYAHERHLYGGPIYALPVIREQVLKAHLDVLISECVMTAVTRSLSIAPGRLSLRCAIVKYFVPVVAEEVVAGMAGVLGARSWLREGAADGVFQKLQRDHAIASIFEGTTHVNLNSVSHQLPFILADDVRRPGEPERTEVLSALFSLTEEAPAWTPDATRLQLSNEGQDEITHAWEWIKRQVADLCTGPVQRDLREVVAELDSTRRRCYARLDDAQGSRSTRAMAVAKDHCVLHAAASCLLSWLCNREALGGAFAAGHWLVLCLHRLLQRFAPGRELPETHLAVLEETILRSLHEDTPFSLAGLAEGRETPHIECARGALDIHLRPIVARDTVG